MAVTLVDTSVILDIVTDDPKWADWSIGALHRVRKQGRLAINPIIYAELSVGFPKIEELELVIETGGFLFLEIPREALFLAGKAFLNYKRRKGPRLGVLPDFLIGAHAAVGKHALITRDVRRVKSHYPSVRLICP